MSRYIDIEPYEKDGWYLQKRYHNEYCEVVKTTPLGSVPTAELNSCEYWDSESHFCALHRPQAEPVKHAHWTRCKTATHHGELYCSICEKESPIQMLWRYCPNCGAKMDEKTLTEVVLEIADSVMVGDRRQLETRCENE